MAIGANEFVSGSMRRASVPAELLAARSEKVFNEPKLEGRPISLVIGADVVGDKLVVEWEHLAHLGVGTVELVFQVPSADQPPASLDSVSELPPLLRLPWAKGQALGAFDLQTGIPEVSVADELPRFDHPDSTFALKECPAVHAALAGLAHASPQMQHEAVATLVARAHRVSSCGCDADKLRARLWRWQRGPARQFADGVYAIRLAGEGTGTRVEVGADEPWEDIYPRVLEANQPVHLALKGADAEQ